MKRRLKLFWVIAATILLLTGCSTDDDRTASKGILHKPPYAGLTDSIGKFPKDAGLLLQRAALLSQNNKHEIATADYKKAWELKPDENTALEYISNLLMVDKVDAAVTLLKKGTEQYPHSPEFNRRLSEVYIGTGRSKQALEQYNGILEKDPSNFEILYDKGMLLARLKDTAGAIQALEKSFSLQPIKYSGIQLAMLYAAKKDPKAIDICDILLSNDSLSQETEPIFMKGVYYSETKQYGKAMEQFDECIKRDWKMTDAYIEKGIIYFEQKRYDQALEMFKMASTVSNTNPDAYFWMGRCYEATGNKEEAKANYERALSLDRYLVEAMEGLQRLR